MGTVANDCPVLNCPVFQNLPHPQAGCSGCVFRRSRYHRNQILYFEGGEAHHLFALHSGVVKIVKPLASGKERITAVVFPGELFGLEALTDSRYPFTAVALRECEICSASREDFLSFMKTHAEVPLGMVRLLVGELERARVQLTSMSFKDARMKVATLLLSLAGKEAPVGAATPTLTLPLSRQEISELLELSPETVSRTLTSLRREQLLTARGRHLVILNRPGLELLAHEGKSIKAA